MPSRHTSRAPLSGNSVDDPQEDATIEDIARAYQMENDSAF